MAEVVSLELSRLKAETDNTKVTPRQLMDLVIDAFDTGFDGKPIRAYVIVETELPDGMHEIEAFRCGSTRHEEIALLAMEQNRLIEKWRRGD